MASFNLSKIKTEVDILSEELRGGREKLGLSIEQVSEKLRIKVDYLEYLESGNFDDLPEGIYQKNFLKEYADFLSLDKEHLLKIFNNIQKDKKIKKERLFSNQVVKNKYFLAIPKILKNTIIGLIVLFCFLYIAYSFKNIFSEPYLNISFPPDNYTTEERSLDFVGSVSPGTEIFINGKNIVIDVNGNFSKKVNLKEGINQVVLEAKKSYGKQNIVQKQILVK